VTRAGWAAAGAAAALWVALAARWFDGPHHGPALDAIPAAALALPLAALASAALWRHRAGVRAVLLPETPALALPPLLALLVRLPLAWHGALGYLTPDGALSGIVALRALEGRGHHVFVPSVPYSGSLKSHLAAGLAALGLDLPRAFALASVAFYALFVAAATRLAARAAGTWAGVASGTLLAFAPAYVTRYSLSNDGNYVEVLGLGTAALVVLAKDAARPGRALAAGALLGLACWAHVLAVIHIAVAGLALLALAARAMPRTVPALAAGAAAGYAPGLLWNAANGWQSFAYLVPGAATASAPFGPGPLARLSRVLGEHLPVLLGYDYGYGPALDVALRALAAGAAAAAVVGAVRLARGWRSAPAEARVALLLAGVNVAVAALALPYIAGNPRYVLFTAAVLPLFVAVALDRRGLRPLFAVLVAAGAATSAVQAPGAIRADAAWRGFARDLEASGVRWCTTDFFIAAKLNFAARERVVCSSKLGPTTTEYFADYRHAVDSAPEVALIAVNATAADKLSRRLLRLGVAHERRELLKPTLLRLSRRVDPEELFPGRAFPMR
jgi:hypothetical protein